MGSFCVFSWAANRIGSVFAAGMSCRSRRISSGNGRHSDYARGWWVFCASKGGPTWIPGQARNDGWGHAVVQAGGQIALRAGFRPLVPSAMGPASTPCLANGARPCGERTHMSHRPNRISRRLICHVASFACDSLATTLSVYLPISVLPDSEALPLLYRPRQESMDSQLSLGPRLRSASESSAPPVLPPHQGTTRSPV